MGTWGVGSFENDDAFDFLNEVFASPDYMVTMQSVLDAVVVPGLWRLLFGLDAPSCCAALAAAEIVAALRGRPGADMPKQVAAFVKGKPKPGRDVVAKAQLAVRQVWTQSELRDLWKEAGDLARWQRAVTALSRRLA